MARREEQLAINFNLKSASDLWKVKRKIDGHLPVYETFGEFKRELFKYFDEYEQPSFLGLVFYLGFCKASDFYYYKNDVHPYKEFIHGFVEQVDSPYKELVHAMIFKNKKPTQSYTKLDRKMKSRVYTQVGQAVSKYAKGRVIHDKRSFYERFGYHQSELVAHLESKFFKGMTWDNYGAEWHIDHIKPTSWFDWTNPDATIKECWALSNLQPLWAILNCIKGNKFEGLYGSRRRDRRI